MSSTVLQAEKLDSRVMKMTIQYENGTAKEVEKGIMIFQSDNNTMSLQAVGLDGIELIGMLLGCTHSILEELGLPTDFIDRVGELAEGEEYE